MADLRSFPVKVRAQQQELADLNVKAAQIGAKAVSKSAIGAVYNCAARIS